MDKCNYCGKVRQKAGNCWGHEANKGKRPKNWKKKEDKEEGASNVEVLLGCTEASAIEYKTEEAIFKIDLWELVLQKLDKILVPSSPPDDNKNNMGNINKEKTKEDSLAGEKGSSGTKGCSSKIKKLAVLARVALLQSAFIWVGDSGASLHCTNDRHGGSNICEGSGTGSIGALGMAMTASSIIYIPGIWFNKFDKEQ